MKDKAEFQQKLGALLEIAKEQGGSVTIEEVRERLESDTLTEEQMNLVFDYLLAQKIVVKGYWKQEEKEAFEFSEEEKGYLKDYEREIETIKPEAEGERTLLFGQVLNGDTLAKERLIELYLKEVVEVAKEMKRQEVFIGDLIQEGNLGVVLGVEMIVDAQGAHKVIMEQVRQSMQLLLEEQEEARNRDKKMVEKVNALDEAITTLTEELGHKVTIDELTVHMGLTEEEIDDILRLTGEEPDKEDTKE